MVLRKTATQIALMRRAGVGRGRDARGVHPRRGARRDDRRSRPRPRTKCSTAGTPARTSSGYHGFPAVACISPNEVIVHGIPGAAGAGRRRHRVDRLRCDHRGLARRRRDHGSGRRDRRGVAAAHRRDAGRARIRDRARRWPATGWATSAPRPSARSTRPGFGVVREYVGHGIGTAMHEDPDVPNYGPPGRGMKLRAGIVLAIEPMVTAGPGRPPARSTTAGRSSPPTDRAPRTSSTRSRSPTTARRS